MATVGFDIYQFKFAVRIPRIKLRKPKILTKRKSANKSRNSSKSDTVAPCSSKLPRKFDTYNRSESVSSDPSFNSDEWIREFNARCKTLPTPKILRHTEAAVVTEDQEGWIILDVSSAMAFWQAFPKHNLGLLLKVTSTDKTTGEPEFKHMD